MAAPESSLPSGLNVHVGMELIASYHEWKPLGPRKGISSEFCEMEFSKNTLEGVRLAREIAIPE